MKCDFCKKEYKREEAFEKHICEPKRRWNQRHDQIGMMAFELFSEFKKFHRIRSKKDLQTVFLESKQYRAYETLAKFFMTINPLNINEYFSYLMRSGAPFRKWTSENHYFKWAHEKIMTEDSDIAVSRSIETLQEYSIEHELELQEVCLNLTGHRLCLWLRTGRISPWFVILCSQTENLLGKLDQEELDSIKELINPLYWRMRVKSDPKVPHLKKELREAGI